MSWLRIDDSFAQHHKFAGWTGAQKWAWLELLCHCARQHTRGYVPEDVRLLPRAVTRPLLDRAEQVGLLDRHPDGTLRVHDWAVYNGTIEDKVALHLTDHPDDSANDVHKAVGGNRNDVLQLVREYRQNGIPGTTEEWYRGTTKPGTKSGSETGTRARNPVPTPSPYPLEDQKPSSLPLDASDQAGRQEPETFYTPEELEDLAHTVLEDMPT